MRNQPMTGFDARWESPEDYIIGITHDIWEGRGVADLDHLYAADIPVRFPGGSTTGNQIVIDNTWATLSEFPDRVLLGEDVIWSEADQGGFLSSHRILSTATHLGDGAFGPASGTKLVFRTIADCAFPEVRLAIEGHSRKFHWGPRSEGADAIRDLELTAAGWQTIYVTWQLAHEPRKLLDLVVAAHNQRRHPPAA